MLYHLFNTYESLLEKLKLTPLKLANVPPPMALHEVDLPANAIDVAVMVQESLDPTLFIGVLHNHLVSLFSWSIKAMVYEAPKLLQIVPIPKAPGCEGSMELQISVTSNKDFAILQHDMGTSNEWIVSPRSSPHYEHPKMLSLGGFIEGIVSCGPGSGGNILLTSGHERAASVRDFRGQESGLGQVVRYPVSISRVEAVSWSSELQKPNEPSLTNDIMIFSLAENGSLFANERLLVRNCTSFLVTPEHLILTTSQHLLKFVRLGGKFEGKPPLTILFPPSLTREKRSMCLQIRRRQTRDAAVLNEEPG